MDRNGNKYIPISNFKWKWTKCSNQKNQGDRMDKQDPFICCLKETHFRPKKIYRLKAI